MAMKTIHRFIAPSYTMWLLFLSDRFLFSLEFILFFFLFSFFWLPHGIWSLGIKPTSPCSRDTGDPITPTPFLSVKLTSFYMYLPPVQPQSCHPLFLSFLKRFRAIQLPFMSVFQDLSQTRRSVHSSTLASPCTAVLKILSAPLLCWPPLCQDPRLL